MVKPPKNFWIRSPVIHPAAVLRHIYWKTDMISGRYRNWSATKMSVRPCFIRMWCARAEWLFKAPWIIYSLKAAAKFTIHFNQTRLVVFRPEWSARDHELSFSGLIWQSLF